MNQNAFPVEHPPMDEHNQKLLHNVHPPAWKNPNPQKKYNLVVIGAGTAGLVTAAASAGLGAKVALIERHMMGGDCLNVGCVPSKCLISSSRVAQSMREAAEFGIASEDAKVDFAAVMQRMRKLRADISHVDSAARFKELGVDVFLGQGSFIDSSTIEVAGQKLKFKKAVIATGARAFTPDIPGLKESGYLTNETVFSLTELPKHLAVIGAGPIGCELAQAFSRFSSEVTILSNSPHLLPREDSDAAEIVQDVFQNENIQMKLGVDITKVNSGTIHFNKDSDSQQLEVDQILVATGRTPNVAGLNLEAVGVKYTPRHGVEVNDYLETSNPRIYAAGDICMQHKFTHAADFAARTVIQNTLFAPFGLGRKKLSALTIPWATYTSPEIAHVGLYPEQAQNKGIEIDTYKQDFEHVDRAIADGETNGFVKVHCKKGTDQIVGASIVAGNAGDLISEITLAMVNGIGLNKIANTIHPYPTQAEAIRKAGDLYNKTKLTPSVKAIFSRWMSLTR